MNEYKLPAQCEKIVERLFVFVDTKDIRQNIRLNLVVNPEIIKILINQVAAEPPHAKVELLRMLSALFAANSFNSLILAKRDREIMEFNHSILESLISLLFAVREYRSAEEMGSLVIPFIHSYPVSSKIVKTVLAITARDFYYEKLDHKMLELSLKVLQKIMKHQRFKEGEPNSYFITYGEETGIKMINKSIKWPFSKGFHIYLKFFIQACTEDDMVLFTLALENDEFVVFVTPEGELRVKAFEQEEPLYIAFLPAQQWITLALSYTLKSKLLKNYYDVHCSVDGEMHERRDLPVPKSVGMSDEIVQLSLGRNFYGLIHTFLLSRSEIVQWNKLVLNSWSEIQSFLVINKKQIRELFAFYHPLLTTCLNQKEIVYDITSQNHGEVFQNTGIYVNPFRSVDVNYYGGLYTFLPFLHILKFYPFAPYPRALTHIFELFATFFDNRFGNVEEEAVNCQFFSISSQLINELDPRFISKEFLTVLRNLSDRFTNFLLRKDFLVGFLWKLNTRKIEDPHVLEGLFEIIEKYYIQFFQWSYGLFSLDDIFHYILDNFEPPRAAECCFSHFARIEAGETIDPQRFSLNFAARTKVLKNVLKLVYVNLASFESIRSITSQSMQMLFGAYSPCLKLLLLQSLCEGVKANSSFYIREFNLLSYLYLYLPQAQLPDELAVIFEILLNALEQDEDNQLLEKNVINRIAECLDRIYTKKCEEVRRFRSNSDRFHEAHLRSGVQLRNQQRNYSEQRVAAEKTRRLQRKLHRGSPIQSHKGLYESIIKLCFYFDKDEEDCLLRQDEYVLILQPYFKLCCLSYRKNIINMIRNTVILAAHGKSILDNLTKFDRLYKLLLNEFVLKELEPDSPDYFPTEQTNYIIRNVYFVIDYMIMGIRNDWGHLYLYLLRLLGLLEEARKDIHKRTNRTPEDIQFAIRVTLRKFILRVIKLAEKDVHNLNNLVFLVYLTVFSNVNDSVPTEAKLFNYYRSFQQGLFIANVNILSSDTVAAREQSSFVDSKLILETASSFRIYNIDLRKSPSIKVSSFINSYLDLQYTNEESQLFKNRFIYLVSAEFKLLRPSEGALRNILSGFLGEHSNQNVTTGEIFSVMLGLCIQSAISTRNMGQLHESLRQLQAFAVQFLLLSSRDGLKQSEHSHRNKQLPKSIISNVLHFLYVIRETVTENEIRSLLQDSLYYIFYFLCLLINCISDKQGRLGSFERCLQLSTIEKQVEEYNFFTFELLKDVFTLKQVIQIPNIEKEKALRLLLNQKVEQHFRSIPRITIEKKFEHATNIHKQNVATIKKDFSQIFSNGFVIKQIPSEYLLNAQSFEKNFVFDYLKARNVNYRRIQRIWRKIWKRLRVYHYFWSVGMNQRETMQLQFRKNYSPPFRHKFSKFLDSNGVRSILEIEPVEPWHVKKVLMEKEFQYRSSNYLYSMHHEEKQTRELSMLEKLLTKSKEKDSSFFVDWIKNNSKRKGYLSIEQQKLRFKYVSTFQKDSHLEFTSFILAEHKPIEKYWPLVEIVGVLERRYLMLRQCLLIEFEDSTSLIFNFINNDKDDFLRLLESKQAEKSDKMALLKLNKVVFYTQKFNYAPAAAVEEACAQWRSNRISSFRYLTLLNKYAGRSQLDPANFPVFPWIIASYDSPTYKYRDLSKTIGGLGSEQLTKHYRSKTETIDPFDPVPAYQYGTHYSSPGMVFNFLIRLQPYTEASRTLQGGKFDLSDRLFSSIRICWQSVTTEISDVRELVPEFYYLPEFLLNIEHHNFGLTQMKERVHNVHLPAWSSNAYEFIATHRVELEGSKVGEHLQEWIDLIFGYKQKGKIAEENLNLFYYLTYENSIDLKEIEDPQIKVSKEAQIMHFGQTPSQLFFKPHPSRSKTTAKASSNFKKVRLLFCLQGSGEVSLLYQREGRLGVFHEYSVKIFNELSNCALHSEVKLLRNNSKENIYFIEDINCSQKTVLFGNGQFMAIGSYINGDLAIFSLASGRKIEEKKGAPRNCIFVNAEENLLFSGGKNGLLEVFEILYGEKETVTLIRIAFEYYQSPVYSISEGGNFYAVCSGSLVAVIKISRSLTYAHDKIKMRGIKMIRSFETNRNVGGAILCPDPLFCLIFFNSLEICSYSINGQLLKLKQTEIALPPQKIRGENFTDLVASVEDNKLLIYSTPFLEVVNTIKLPNKTFRQMRFFEDRCYLTTNQGEILCLSDLEQEQGE